MGKLVLTLAGIFLVVAPMLAENLVVAGRIVDSQGYPIPQASVRLIQKNSIALQTQTDDNGRFEFRASSPGCVLKVDVQGFEPLVKTLTVAAGMPSLVVRMERLAIRTESINVTADVDETSLAAPDPAQHVMVRQEMLDANPGRPGSPVSIPGMPIETASGGIKAPQYFVPGVAGDHGEPIAQYILVGSYRLPNNLSANAHGNGYADPNILASQAIDSVRVDGGAFNVLEGNHALNLGAAYGLRQKIGPSLTVTGDYRDIDVVGGLSPEGPDVRSWI